MGIQTGIHGMLTLEEESSGQSKGTVLTTATSRQERGLEQEQKTDGGT